MRNYRDRMMRKHPKACVKHINRKRQQFISALLLIIQREKEVEN